MSRGSNLKPFENTRAVRIRAPKSVLQKLERLSAKEIGAWVYHADHYLTEHAPERSLEHPPAPIPDAALEEQPLNARLSEILGQAKPSNWQALGDSITWTPEQFKKDQQFWDERDTDRARERALMVSEPA